ncbi:unnamed protein product [Calypogeia fissa]
MNNDRMEECGPSNTVDGNNVDGNKVDGNTVGGNNADGNTADGNTVDGNKVGGNNVDGNQLDGSTGNSEKRSKPEEQGGQLLPGIPNRITLEHICTKLPWKAFCILSSVSPTWWQAIHDRSVYNTRVQCSSTDTLLVHSHPFEVDFSCEGLFLYCPREKNCYELPQIPKCNRGIPWGCQCIALDGKIYVLGGGTGYGDSCEESDDEEHKKVFKEVYVLDLVGGAESSGCRKWKQCASMQEGRLKFGCGLIGGKIYAFGGASHYGPVHGSEVYDPQADTWTTIRPMKAFRFGHHVATLGEVLVVYGGEVFDQPQDGVRSKPFLNEDGFRVPSDSVHDAIVMEAYHPVKDEWRQVESFQMHDSEYVFIAGGNFHLITKLGIFVQAVDSKSWKNLHSNSFPSLQYHSKFTPHAPVIGNDALYLGVDWSSKYFSGSCLLEGKGFGSKNLEIVWDETDCGDAQDYADLKCGILL